MLALNRVILVMITLTLAACATPSNHPKESVAADEAAKEFVGDPNLASVYLYPGIRKNAIFSDRGEYGLIEFYLDDKSVGELKPNEFLFVKTNPGKHTIKYKDRETGKVCSPLELTLEKSEIVFVRTIYDTGANAALGVFGVVGALAGVALDRVSLERVENGRDNIRSRVLVKARD